MGLPVKSLSIIMSFTTAQKKRIQEKLNSLDSDSLTNFVEEQSQTRTFNPDVAQKESGRFAYLMGTREGRERYAADKKIAEERLKALAEMVKAEEQKRFDIRQGEIKRGENVPSAPAGSMFEVRDDPTEYGLSMTEAVEKRLAEQQAVADSDTAQLQRELGGIDPEAMRAARNDRNRATQKSLERELRNTRARATREDKEMAEKKAERKGYKKSLRDADAGFEEAFEESIGDYESRQGVEQEAAEKADSLFKEPTLRAEPIPRAKLTPRAEPVPDMNEEEAGRLFKMIMGSSFDPVSSMDKGKMEILKKAKSENPDLSDSQLALKIYKDYM